MPPRSTRTALPLPRGWRSITRAGVLQAISVAAMAMTSAWSKASTGRSSRQRALAEVDRLRTDVALISILDLAVKDRAQLALENAALRHQLAGYSRAA